MYAKMVTWQISIERDNRRSTQARVFGWVLLNYCSIQTLSLSSHKWSYRIPWFWVRILTQGGHEVCARHLRVPAMPWHVHLLDREFEQQVMSQTNVTDLTPGLKSITKSDIWPLCRLYNGIRFDLCTFLKEDQKCHLNYGCSYKLQVDTQVTQCLGVSTFTSLITFSCVILVSTY